MWEENQKIIDIVNEKTFQTGLSTEKEKPRFVVRGRTLVKERLGRNKMLFSSQQDQTANGFIYQIQAFQCSLHQRDRSLASYQLLARLKTRLTRIPLCRPTWRAS